MQDIWFKLYMMLLFLYFSAESWSLLRPGLWYSVNQTLYIHQWVNYGSNLLKTKVALYVNFGPESCPIKVGLTVKLIMCKSSVYHLIVLSQTNCAYQDSYQNYWNEFKLVNMLYRDITLSFWIQRTSPESLPQAYFQKDLLFIVLKCDFIAKLVRDIDVWI